MHTGRLALALSAAATLSLGLLALPSPAGASTKAGVKAFNSLTGQIKKDLSFCTAAAADTQIELGLVLSKPTTVKQTTLVSLDTTSKKAQTACDMAKDTTILHLATVKPSGPISSIHSLSTIAIDAETWASTDTTHVLHDIQTLVESSGNATKIESQLNSDVSQADGDAASINSALSGAAHRVGVKGFKGVGLVTWES
jgi:hypothetical protein